MTSPLRKITAVPIAEPVARGQAALLLAVSVGLVTAVWLLIFTWLISGDLEGATVMAGLVFSGVVLGLGALARSGRVRLAAGLMVGLLTLLIALDSASYGLAAPGAAAFVLPVVLAACCLGFGWGMAVAVVCATAVWAIAWATYAGWYAAYDPATLSHLTFNAPFYTVILLLTAVIVGAWSRYLVNLLTWQGAKE